MKNSSVPQGNSTRLQHADEVLGMIVQCGADTGSYCRSDRLHWHCNTTHQRSLDRSLHNFSLAESVDSIVLFEAWPISTVTGAWPKLMV